ncbi:proteasome inhibitor PI31 subunit-like [Bradysia coprophila]|uniref:proteasome inhibitor PI31 subunit-like n=1 Tax=Bradysia coprophila TaxID=38358 RepID=UPI00187DA50A|nr:proteasome inhibitor PI31 subunit-like [Bradysia coprophila]
MDGWSLLFKSVKREIEEKSDVFIAFVHWQLLHAGFKCLGIGDDKTLSDLDEESEELPDGWNMNKVAYSLRYKYDKDVFVLIGTVVDDGCMVLNLLNGKSLEVSNTEFVLDRTVVSLTGKLNVLIPNFANVTTRLQNDLIEPVLSTTKKMPETQTSQLIQPDIPSNNLWYPMPPWSPYLPPRPSNEVFSNESYRLYHDWGRTPLLSPFGLPTPTLPLSPLNPQELSPAVPWNYNPPPGLEMNWLNQPGPSGFIANHPVVPPAVSVHQLVSPDVQPAASVHTFIPVFGHRLNRVAPPPEDVPQPQAAPIPAFIPPDVGGHGRRRLP